VLALVLGLWLVCCGCLILCFCCRFHGSGKELSLRATCHIIQNSCNSVGDGWEEEYMLGFFSVPMEGVDIWGFPGSIGSFPSHATSLVHVIIELGSTAVTVSSLVLRSSLSPF